MEELKVVTQEAKDMEQLSDTKAILFSGAKEITFDGVTICVRFPRLKEKNILDKEYSLKYLKMIREKQFPTMRAWRKELEANGMWTEADENIFTEAQKTYMEAYKEWYSFKYEDRIDNPAFDDADNHYTKATLNYMKLFTDRESMFTHTIEKIIENEQIVKQVVMCAFKDANMTEPLFKNENELESYPNGEAVINLVRDCTTFWMGVGERFLEQLPASISGKESTN